MDVRSLCRKLKPLIGEQAERYWLAYLAEDNSGRQELEMALSLMAARLLGSNVDNPEVHLSVPPEQQAAGPYTLGSVCYANEEKHAFGLREDELIQHTAIFGRSGAGKTNTVVQMMLNLLEHERPFLVFDWKRNYRDLLAVRDDPIMVYTVGRPAVPFVFNPLIPPHGVDAAVWLKKLIEIIAHAYYLGEGVMFLFQEAIHAVYTEWGVYQGIPDRYPTFSDVYAWLRAHPVKGRQALWMDSAMRGIKSICFGHMGNVVNTGIQPNLAALMSQNVILELDGLSNADKTLMVESMLLWIHHWRLTQPDRETFKHAIIIEEAHHILRKQAGGGAEAITETILREIRELGEAIILVDQHPSMISIPALGNTYTTITMNLKHRSDVNAIAAAMLMEDDERELLGRLPVGMAVVKLQGRWTRPFQVKVPFQRLEKGCITDSDLIQRFPKTPGIVPNSPPTRAIDQVEDEGFAEYENAFLKDVAAHSFSGVVERYRRLNLSRRRGTACKESCIVKGWLTPVELPVRTARIVLLDITDKGKQKLRSLDVDVPDRSRWGSLEHEYWKQRLARYLESQGLTVRVEEPVNGYTDIVAEAQGRTVAVEVETGKSDWQANLAKNQRKGFDHIIIAVTNEDALKKLQTGLGAGTSGVTLCPAWEIEDMGKDRILGQ